MPSLVSVVNMSPQLNATFNYLCSRRDFVSLLNEFTKPEVKGRLYRNTDNYPATEYGGVERKSDMPRERVGVEMIAAAAQLPLARGMIDMAAEELFQQRSAAAREWVNDKVYEDGDPYWPEVVIGSGVHAAIYAVNRINMGEAPPLIVTDGRVGGHFAACERPVYWLNSRNRPEDVTAPREPGKPGSLNALPGAAIQPSDLSAQEYQPQVDLGFAIRMNLLSVPLMMGRVSEVMPQSTSPQLRVFVTGLELPIYTDRVVMATGLTQQPTFGDQGAIPFQEFCKIVASDPTRVAKWKNVGVIGAGDSGKSAVQWLLGRGPADSYAMPMQARAIERVYWFGQYASTREAFAADARTLYRGLCSYFPEEAGLVGSKIYPVAYRAASVLRMGESLVVRTGLGSDYYMDAVIDCTGFYPASPPFSAQADGYRVPYSVDFESIAEKQQDHPVFYVGPCASLPATIRETERFRLDAVPENATSISRYGTKTAKLARALSVFDAFRPDGRPRMDVPFDLWPQRDDSTASTSDLNRRSISVLPTPSDSLRIPLGVSPDDVIREKVIEFMDDKLGCGMLFLEFNSGDSQLTVTPFTAAPTRNYRRSDTIRRLRNMLFGDDALKWALRAYGGRVNVAIVYSPEGRVMPELITIQKMEEDA